MGPGVRRDDNESGALRATTRNEAAITSRIHVHEISQQRIDLVVPALAGEHAVMADAGLHAA